MNRKLLSIILAIVGIVAVILGIVCFCSDSGNNEYNEYYGGDAYTGIQNAAAQTARNVKDLGNIVKVGFGSVLLVAGFALAGCGICGLIPEKKTEQTAPVETIIQGVPEKQESVENEAIVNAVENITEGEVKIE